MSSQRHPHPAVAVDLSVFTLRERRLHALLIQRARDPFKGSWALPGGFVRIDEDLPDAAQRELEEETGVREAFLEQVRAFGRPDRDPRERVVSVAYVAIIPSDALKLQAGGDASAAQWFDVDGLPKLAFDHGEILAVARMQLADKARRTALAVQFLPPEFTLTELQHVHEAILGEKIDKRNFRKWVGSLAYLRSTGKTRKGGAHRPAELFRASQQAGESTAAVASSVSAHAPDSASKAEEKAYRRGYQDALREFQGAMSETQRQILKRLR